MDYREKYKGIVGACATCLHVRSVVKGKTIRDEDRIITYDGGKVFTCAKNTSMSGKMLDEPNMRLPVNKCWEAKDEKK